MSHWKWRETKQQPSKVRSGRQISCCLVSLNFQCNDHCTDKGCHIKNTPRPKTGLLINCHFGYTWWHLFYLVKGGHCHIWSHLVTSGHRWSHWSGLPTWQGFTVPSMSVHQVKIEHEQLNKKLTQQRSIEQINYSRYLILWLPWDMAKIVTISNKNTNK